MPVRDEVVQALRSQLAAESDADLEESARLMLTAERTSGTDGLGELMYAAFKCAVRDRWAAGWARQDIIWFVANLRGSTDEAAKEINATAAENQLRLALGDPVAPYPDMEARGQAQFFLLLALTADYTTEDLGVLMAEARLVADEYLASSPRLVHPTPDGQACGFDDHRWVNRAGRSAS